MTFSFEKGSDLLVKADGDIVGGIVRLRRIVKNDPDEIREFLTDAPVALIPRKKYILKFYMHSENGCAFDGDLDTVEISGRGYTETYTMFAPTRCESRAIQNSDIDHIVTVTAYERSVADE